MPYDLSQNAADEYRLLLTELKRAFLHRLSKARQGHVARDHFNAFADHCAANGSDVITFNYDDFLDEALGRTGRWTPEWGYGFFQPDLAGRRLPRRRPRTTLRSAVAETARVRQLAAPARAHRAVRARLDCAPPRMAGRLGHALSILPYRPTPRIRTAHRAACTFQVRSRRPARSAPRVDPRVRDPGQGGKRHVHRLLLPVHRLGGPDPSSPKHCGTCPARTWSWSTSPPKKSRSGGSRPDTEASSVRFPTIGSRSKGQNRGSVPWSMPMPKIRATRSAGCPQAGAESGTAVG